MNEAERNEELNGAACYANQLGIKDARLTRGKNNPYPMGSKKWWAYNDGYHSAQIRTYTHRKNERKYMTGGKYGKLVMVNLDFGWIISTKYTHEDLSNGEIFIPA